MTPATIALARTERAWPHLFGDGRDTVDRRQVAAQLVAQDLRDNPASGLAAAEEPDRHAFGSAYVRLRRQIEATRGRPTVAGAAPVDLARRGAWPGLGEPEGVE